MKTTVTTSVGGKQITIETGRLAKQADGSVLVSCGNNMVLVTAVSSRTESEKDFFPLMVEYQEKFYATGKIPGGYFKREGKPTTNAVLTARLIDRPIRPKFPEGYRNETQVVATVLSADGSFPVEILSSIGASAALHVSDIPFEGPTAAVQVGRVDGQLIANPTPQQLEKSDMDIIVAGTRNGILMVEGEAKFISEADAMAALKFGHASLVPLLNAQDELREKAGSKQKRAFTAAQIDADFKAQAEKFLKSKIEAALSIREKMERYAAAGKAADEAMAALVDVITDDKLKSKRAKELGVIVEDLKYKAARSMILDRAIRIDGRDMKTVRPISCEVGMLPRAHGSGLFTRGETQVLGTVTLGTGDDEQMIDALLGTEKKQFMLHYNFPPFSVGEVGRFGGQGRREIGHGNLAERALKAIIPTHEKFPYTIRIVSEVLESNGSSSMGTVCSGLLALLDAGVPVKANVAGIAMGLIKEGDRVAVLTDILGDEDHLGDMDFKVAGSNQGITSLQMDIKIDSVSFQVMETALAQAKEGRSHILNEMEKVMKTPRGHVSEFAPRIETIKIHPDKIREVIGAGGKVIRGITEQTGVKIEIEDDGTIRIASADPEATKKAIAIINDICAEAEVGKVYRGRIVKITDFGAFVEILPNTQGLLHISEIAHERVRAVTDVVQEGEEVDVKVLDIDRAGRIKLSRKVLLSKDQSGQIQ
ncbi:MAG: polyribonucleotide nucleotidyltransferase [Oligoflexia bacterium]|nr:MAG: polyribonucleotide nucleotidyltransferase [Oligoflexia bacterium]